MQVGIEAEERRKLKVVDAVVTGAAKGRGGVVRLEDTLGAVHEGRVQTLVIREGLRSPGWRCQGCGYLTTKELADCPFCQGAFTKIPDAVELAVRSVMQSGGEVEVIHEDQGLYQYENIGGILRY